MQPISIGIFGVNSSIGPEILSGIEDSNITNDHLRLFNFDADAEDAELFCTFKDDEVLVEQFYESAVEEIDIIIFCGEIEQSKQVFDAFNDCPNRGKKYLIDCIGDGLKDYSGESYSKQVGIYSPISGIEHLEEDQRVITLPLGSVQLLAPVLFELKKLSLFESLVVTNLEPVSSAGQIGLDELWEQGMAIYNQQQFEPEAFSYNIAYNCIPQVGLMCDDGQTTQEKVFEAQVKSFVCAEQKENFAITSTFVRAPLFYCNCLSVTIKYKEQISKEDVFKIFEDAKHIEFSQGVMEQPMPVNSVSKSEVFVGRARVVENTLTFWLVADNLRAGVSKNAGRLILDIFEKCT